MNTFVIADPHFDHANIIKYCNRPYADVAEMNKDLIKRWNAVVRKEDKVYILGDFSLGREAVEKITPKLNGIKYLIKGNHDTRPNQFYRDCGFKEVYDHPIIVDFYILSHEPMQLSETTPYFNYYGHVHNDEKYRDTATSKCVSVERIGYMPWPMVWSDNGNALMAKYIRENFAVGNA